MSCDDVDGVDCGEVLDRLSEYIDQELDTVTLGDIKHHLDRCSECLREYGIEDAVKVMVAKSCGCERAPSELLDRIRSRIRTARPAFD